RLLEGEPALLYLIDPVLPSASGVELFFHKILSSVSINQRYPLQHEVGDPLLPSGLDLRIPYIEGLPDGRLAPARPFAVDLDDLGDVRQGAQDDQGDALRRFRYAHGERPLDLPLARGVAEDLQPQIFGHVPPL